MAEAGASPDAEPAVGPAVFQRVVSSPPDASVRIAGRVVCSTPCRLEASEGRRVAVLTRPGYARARLVVPPGGGEELRVTLRRERAAAEAPPPLPVDPF
ncbi:MAG: hypothetical protein SangKO_024500 [Sandaracinaceae bacterium]